ncbi:DNA adenine methylase [Acetivibrio cellulolyticus]|uniref:DNA adenine methylase n=1 Tax=Acetivibrio cellulolyticus TaxID=35830 RepID=UPI0002481B86|nr:DNA adenine methylase [Acetivibrio cellulolyticus]
MILTEGLSYFLQVNIITSTRKYGLKFLKKLYATLMMKANLKYKRNKSIFAYIDPPYYKEGPGLYRFYFTHKQHVELAKFIKPKLFPWLISYDDVDEIRNIYERSSCINLYMDYSVKTSKKGKELLISNLTIPPIAQDNEIETVM